MTPTWVQLANLAAAVMFILALKGLSSPKSARRGVLIGAAGATIATVLVFFSGLHLKNLPLIFGCMAIGAVIGAVAARRVQMTQMPQMVALFNGVGGGAAALVAVIEFLHNPDADAFSLGATVFTVIIGAVSFSGSFVTFLKLQELITTRPVIIPGGKIITPLVAGIALVLAAWLVIDPTKWILIALLLVSLLFGVLFVLPVGGADVPIVISLLNAFTGLAVAASGFVLGNVLLLIAGTLVGAAGTLLTQLMASAMGRPITNILFGAFAGPTTAGGGVASDRPVRSGSAAGRGDHARLREQGDPGARLRPGRRPGAEHAARAGRPAGRARDRGGLRDPPGRRPHARAHERAARGGQRAVRAAQGDGRDQPRVLRAPTWPSWWAPTTW